MDVIRKGENNQASTKMVLRDLAAMLTSDDKRQYLVFSHFEKNAKNMKLEILGNVNKKTTK